MGSMVCGRCRRNVVHSSPLLLVYWIHRLNLERLNLEWDIYPNGLNPEWD
jgi:hypothetical protein